MLDISLEEAQLFRFLASFFGKEKVVYKASLNLVLGGNVEAPRGVEPHSFAAWAKEHKCLFTVMNEEGDPRLVVEFKPGFCGIVDSSDAQYWQFVEPVLRTAGLHYITVSREEFAELTNPEGTLDFFTFLESKIEQDVSV